MAWYDDWDGYDEVTPPEPGASLTDYTFLVNLGALSSDWWSAVKSDGGDIRASKADGTQLPCDLIYFTDGSPGSGLLAIKFTGTKSSVTSETVRIYSGNAAASIPADSDTYGADNAYASHCVFFSPGGGDADRTVNNASPTGYGSISLAGASGPIDGSKATDYSGGGGKYVTFPDSTPLDVSASSMLFVFAVNTVGTSNYLIQKGTYPVANYFCYCDYGYFKNDLSGAVNYNLNPTTGVWYRGSFTDTGSGAIGYINGSSVGTSASTNDGANSNTLTLGRLTGVGGALDGKMSFIEIHNSALAAEWIDYWSDMLADSDQSDFYSFDGWTALGGGAIELAGTGGAETDQSGALLVERILAGTGEASTDQSGDLLVERLLSGTGSASSDASGSLSSEVNLSGTSGASSDQSGELLVERLLVATGEASTDQSGGIFVARLLAGTGDASSTASGTLDAGPDILTGLVLHYTLEEASGTVVDQSSGGNDGTAYGTIQNFSGIHGKCVKVLTNNEHVYAGTFNPGSDITISCWASLDSALSDTQAAILLSKANSSDGSNAPWRFLIYQSGAQPLLILANGGDSTNKSVNLTITPGTPTHLAVTLTAAGGVQFYQDGAPLGSPASGFSIGSDTDAEIMVGGRHNTGAAFSYNNFKGLLDDVRIYSRVLTDEDVEAIYDDEYEAPATFNAAWARGSNVLIQAA